MKVFCAAQRLLETLIVFVCVWGGHGMSRTQKGLCPRKQTINTWDITDSQHHHLDQLQHSETVEFVSPKPLAAFREI